MKYRKFVEGIKPHTFSFNVVDAIQSKRILEIIKILEVAATSVLLVKRGVA